MKEHSLPRLFFHTRFVRRLPDGMEVKMLCDECKTNQAVYYKIIEINGNKTEKHLCAACQKKYNDFALLKFSGLENLFGTFTEGAAEKKKQAVCPQCGTGYDEFLKTGYLGCANCYGEFRRALTPIIYKSQGSLTHAGKRPRLTPEDLKQQKALKLKKELENAVAEERYIDAQKIKNELDKLVK